MRSLRNLIVVVGLSVGLAPAAKADVLCASASRAVKVRVPCSAREYQPNPAAFGLVGARGDKGDLGAQGPPGAKGAPEAPGVAARSSS
jgi:hypothetical protein